MVYTAPSRDSIQQRVLCPPQLRMMLGEVEQILGKRISADDWERLK
jgi:hypothetical protein